MRLYEFEAKRVLATEGVSVPKQYGLVSTLEELRKQSPAYPAMVKAQIVVDADRRTVELDLATGSFDGSMPEGAARLRVHHRIDRWTHFEATFETDEGGAFTVEGLAAGQTSVQRYDDGSWGPG